MPVEGRPIAPSWVLWAFLLLLALGACGALFGHDDRRKITCVTVAAVSALLWAWALRVGLVRVRRADDRVRPSVTYTRAVVSSVLPFVLADAATNDHGLFAYRVGLYLSSVLIGVLAALGLTRLPIFRRRSRTN